MAAAAERPLTADALLLLVPSFIWGTTWYAIKFQLGPVPPELSVAYRFGLAAVLLLGWCLVRGIPLRFPWRRHVALAVQGLFLFALNYVLVYWSEGHLKSGLVALIFGLLVLWNLIGTRLFFGTPMTAPVLGGALLGLVGVALVVLPDLTLLQDGVNRGLGILLAVLGTLAASAGNLWSQRLYRSGAPVVPSTAWSMLYGALCVAAWCVARGLPFTWDPSPGYLGSLVYLAFFGSVIAFITYLTLLGRIGAGRAGYTAVIIPVLAMATSTVFEGYRWTPTALAGIVLVLLGNLLVLRRKPAPRAAASSS